MASERRGSTAANPTNFSGYFLTASAVTESSPSMPALSPYRSVNTIARSTPPMAW